MTLNKFCWVFHGKKSEKNSNEGMEWGRGLLEEMVLCNKPHWPCTLKDLYSNLATRLNDFNNLL